MPAPLARRRGFTLIELIVTVAIIGILATIAFPSYLNYVMRSNRTVAKSALVEITARQEAYLADRKTYAASLNLLGYPASTTFVGSSKEYTAANSNSIYSLAVSSATATTFTLAATPIGSQTRDSACGTLSIDELSRKTASGPKGTACWQ